MIPSVGEGLMKIYTGTGDQGRTSLFSGERIAKDNIRVEAYGNIDELISFLGTLAAAIPAEAPDLREHIPKIQSELFHVGAWLATTPDAPMAGHLTSLATAAERLEKVIDQLQEGLEPLSDFILPGGHPAAAMAHVARSVCRRAERRVVSLAQASADKDTSPPEPLQHTLIYLNRLSDYLFVLARTLNKASGIADTIWEK
jgi:cob(I)alamin adenosyltransferase